MKFQSGGISFFIIFLLLSFNVFSCPDLQGTYFCANDRGLAFNFKVHQYIQNNITHYIFDEDFVVIADGTERKIADETQTGTFNQSYMATCQRENLQIDSRGDFYKDGVQNGFFITRSTFSLNENNDLFQSIYGLFTSNGQDIPVNVELECRRLNSSF